jgi:dihydrofolate reductase
MSTTSLIVAMADNGVIGKNGELPWRIPEDMRHFKALTIGKPCIMGRKTWDSLPKKPLPGRENIVVTRDAAFLAQGAAVFHSLEDAFAHACGAAEICVIGGTEIYKATLSFATCIYLTEVHGQFEGDAALPPFDTAIWRETSREDHSTPDGLRYSYVTLERRG